VALRAGAFDDGTHRVIDRSERGVRWAVQAGQLPQDALDIRVIHVQTGGVARLTAFPDPTTEGLPVQNGIGEALPRRRHRRTAAPVNGGQPVGRRVHPAPVTYPAPAAPAAAVTSPVSLRERIVVRVE
jgi:hypothetical protein